MKQARTSLIRAIKRGDHLTIRRLLDMRRWGEMDSQGMTPLDHAAYRGDTKAIQRLIEAGADLNCGRNTGYRLVSCAVMKGHAEALRALRTAGVRLTPDEIKRLCGVARYPPQIDSPRTRDRILRLLEDWPLYEAQEK